MGEMIPVKYFIVGVDEDGTPFVYTTDNSKALLNAFLPPDDGGWLDPRMASTVDIVGGSDPKYWEGKYLIIKGHVVQPGPKEKVVQWEID